MTCESQTRAPSSRRSWAERQFDAEEIPFQSAAQWILDRPEGLIAALVEQNDRQVTPRINNSKIRGGLQDHLPSGRPALDRSGNGGRSTRPQVRPLPDGRDQPAVSLTHGQVHTTGKFTR